MYHFNVNSHNYNFKSFQEIYLIILKREVLGPQLFHNAFIINFKKTRNAN